MASVRPARLSLVEAVIEPFNQLLYAAAGDKVPGNNSRTSASLSWECLPRPIQDAALFDRWFGLTSLVVSFV